MDNEKFDGWVTTLRAEFGEYSDDDWIRVEHESKITTVDDLEEVFQRMTTAMGFDYVDVKLVTEGDSNV
jgi:hypothetical protein